ncbi:hypothetical protein GW937_00650 [Candidatus Kaiserbacteria bacterium]|nr:hypothetical protein [Candidatus Kaiserbacteria bacterium]NCT01904.1 hypothetical protein [Candidatus Parcubacteria bacterium]
MSQKSIVLIVSIFVLIVAGMFIYANLKKAEIAETSATPNEETVAVDVPYDDITRIDAKHYIIDGVHTIVGEISMPTPCDLLEAEAVVMESYPEQVSVNFSVINTAEVCAQMTTEQRFKVSFSASPEAVITAKFMGRAVTLNLIPAGANEKPEDFELFLKG